MERKLRTRNAIEIDQFKYTQSRPLSSYRMITWPCTCGPGVGQAISAPYTAVGSMRRKACALSALSSLTSAASPQQPHPRRLISVASPQEGHLWRPSQADHLFSGGSPQAEIRAHCVTRGPMSPWRLLLLSSRGHARGHAGAVEPASAQIRRAREDSGRIRGDLRLHIGCERPCRRARD